MPLAFVDLHHNDLFYALHLLFEKRLGYELYRPIGLDWFHEGYWKIAEPYGNALDTVNQFLEISSSGWDMFKALNGSHYIADDIYHVYDGGHAYYQRAITLEKFKEMKFDLIISSIPRHDETFQGLKKYQPQAKFIAQMGNINQTSRLSNILHSVPYKSLSGQNTCFAHQEIDPNHYFYTSPDPKAKRIFSTVNCLPYPELYNLYKGLLPEVDFRAYGASCPNGPLNGSKDVSSHMREASLGWHCKPGGGLGHSAMGWMASGRGVITKMSDHRQYGGDATRLFEPGITCLDIEARDVTSNCMQIRKLLDPAVCLKLSENAYKRFREVINYNEEELRVRKFLERLI